MVATALALAAGWAIYVHSATAIVPFDDAYISFRYAENLAAGRGLAEPYSARLLDVMRDHEAAAGRELPVGVYAALTGPCYETPAEIRALAALGADAVGMSTAREAEAAAERGLEVAAVSCVTNLAAGLGTVIGLVSAYLGGWIDGALMRLADILLAFPTFLLAAFLNIFIA